MNTYQNRNTISDTAMSIIRIVASLGVIICSLLQLFDVWENAVNISIPLIGAVLLIQAIQEWKKQRGIAIFCLCSAAIVLICTIVVWFFA